MSLEVWERNEGDWSKQQVPSNSWLDLKTCEWFANHSCKLMQNPSHDCWFGVLADNGLVLDTALALTCTAGSSSVTFGDTVECLPNSLNRGLLATYCYDLEHYWSTLKMYPTGCSVLDRVRCWQV